MSASIPDTLATPLPPPHGVRRRPRGRWRLPASIAAVLVVAVVAGVVWSQLSPRLQFLITVIGPFPVSEATAGRVVDADAWFAVLSIVVGVAAGVGTVLVVAPLSRWRAPVALVGTAAGLFVMFAVGQLLANSRLVWSWNPVAGDNHEVTGPLVLRAWGTVTLAPIVALAIVLGASLLFGDQRSDD